MNDRIKFVIIAAVTVLTFVWWLWDVKLSKSSQIKEKRTELTEMMERFQKLETMANDLGSLQQRFDRAIAALDSAAVKIPSRENYVSILEEIRTIADKQGVTIVSLSPDRVDTFPAVKHKLTRTGKHVERFPVQVNLRGDYLTIGAFLEELQKAPTVINIGSFSLESELDRDGKMLACALVLFTYVYSESV